MSAFPAPEPYSSGLHRVDSNNAAGSHAPVNPEFAEAVLHGLARESAGLARKGQKTLPPAWFYDDVGSALFEAITALPEYGLTRAEASLLRKSSDDIVRSSQCPAIVIELGSGSGTKTRHLLTAAARYHAVRYFPIDISAAALQSCVKILDTLGNVTIEPVEATYLSGIDTALAHRKPGESALLLFLGSTIGNFNRAEAASFLARVRRRMQPGDRLLLGADLVKSGSLLLSAYDDPVGVTAAFNKNLLARINRELDGRFDLSLFAHEARWNERRSRIEMHLRSRRAQNVHIGALGIDIPFAANETIWTESSHKFRPEEVSRIGCRAGWSCERQWVESGWGFAETLFRKSE